MLQAATENHFLITNVQKIGIAAIGVLVVNALLKAKAATRINILPRSINDISFKGLTPYMKLIVEVQNTSNQQFVLYSLTGSVTATVNGTRYVVGYVYTFTPTTIAPNSQTLVAIEIRLSALQIINSLINIFTGGFGQSIINLDGYANIDKYQIPLNLDFQLGS